MASAPATWPVSRSSSALPTMSTLIATCNDVDTRLTLSASAAQVAAGDRLVLSATLRVRSDGADYGELSGMRLNGRSVQLKRRPSGSSGAWTTSWMKWAEVARAVHPDALPARHVRVPRGLRLPGQRGPGGRHIQPGHGQGRGRLHGHVPQRGGPDMTTGRGNDSPTTHRALADRGQRHAVLCCIVAAVLAMSAGDCTPRAPRPTDATRGVIGASGAVAGGAFGNVAGRAPRALVLPSPSRHGSTRWMPTAAGPE